MQSVTVGSTVGSTINTVGSTINTVGSTINTVGSTLQPTALIIIGVVLLALLIVFIMYIRGDNSRERKLEAAREKLRLMNEIEELEK